MTQQKRYREIADKLAERIKTGAYTGGQKLPAIRTLAKIHNVALLTAKHALDTLVKQGLAVPVGQSGYYAQTGETAGKNNTIVIAVYDFFKLTSVIEKLFRTFEKRSSFKIEVRYFLEKDFLENPEIVRNSNLIIANEWMMHEIYRNKLFQDINPRFSGFPVKRADFYSELLDLFSINRQQIALPLFFSPMLLFFNRSIFKNRRLGFPDSSWKWTDLEQAAEKLSQPGKNGKQHAGLQTNILNKNRLNAMILQKTGGIILPGRQAEEKKFFSSMFEALDFIRRLNQKFNLTLDMSMIENNFFDRQRIAMTYLTMVLSGTGSQTLQKIYPHLGITP
ncbi:MAG TPA: hypothetical protein DC049_02210, partial [Spirochaetia bacterium]|nr:hypothetical protein [Spirochaetia bacterium]